MEKFLAFKHNLEIIEQERMRLAVVEEEQYTAILKWGKTYYTYEKRMEVIEYYKKSETEWVIEDLMQINQKFESGEICHSDIIKLGSYDTSIVEFEENKYKNSLINKIHSFILGGE
jgi:hypothetical protein